MGWWCRSENAIVSQYFGGQFVKTSHWFAVDDFHSSHAHIQVNSSHAHIQGIQ